MRMSKQVLLMLVFMTEITSFLFNMVHFKILMAFSINISTKKTFKDILVCNCYAMVQNYWWLSVQITKFSDLGAGADSGFFKPDLAIITLSHRFALTNKINPICLPIRSNGVVKFNMQMRQVYTVTGWGIVKSVLNGHNIEHRHHSKLRLTKVHNVPYEKCYEMWHGVEIPDHLARRSKFQTICFKWFYQLVICSFVEALIFPWSVFLDLLWN